MSRWRDVVRVHRLEHPFPINYLCYAVMGACYGVRDAHQLFAAPVLLAVIANIFSFVGVNPLNALVDIPTDALTQGKDDVAHAALRLGRHHAIGWTVAETTFALAAAITAALWLGRALIAVGVGLSIALCLLYNLEPVRLKRRGLANPIAIALAMGPLQSLVSYSAVRADLTASAWLVFIGLGTLLTGRCLWWTLPDETGDQAAGMTTPTVRYGASRTILIACNTTVLGLGLLGWGLWWRYGPLWALLGVAINSPFLLSELALLRRAPDCGPRHDRGPPNPALPSSTQVRYRDFFSTIIALILVVLLPLVAHRM
ncbi:MAG: UbiA family prenyltransferase [Pseudonocardiaceae bacterium]